MGLWRSRVEQRRGFVVGGEGPVVLGARGSARPVIRRPPEVLVRALASLVVAGAAEVVRASPLLVGVSVVVRSVASVVAVVVVVRSFPWRCVVTVTS